MSKMSRLFLEMRKAEYETGIPQRMKRDCGGVKEITVYQRQPTPKRIYPMVAGREKLIEIFKTSK